MNKQLHEQRHAAKDADIGRAEALSQARRERRAAQTSAPITKPKTMPANETAIVIAAACVR